MILRGFFCYLQVSKDPWIDIGVGLGLSWPWLGNGHFLRGGGGGRASEVLPLRKGGAEKVLAMLKGGHKQFWGSFYAIA